MFDDNKSNLIYFESYSMKDLYETMVKWQITYQKRLLSTNIQKDKGKFCCIALSNPSEVIIKDGWSSGGAAVSTTGALSVITR